MRALVVTRLVYAMQLEFCQFASYVRHRRSQRSNIALPLLRLPRESLVCVCVKPYRQSDVHSRADSLSVYSVLAVERLHASCGHQHGRCTALASWSQPSPVNVRSHLLSPHLSVA